MGLQKGMTREERETGDAGIEPLGSGRGWTPGASGGPGSREAQLAHLTCNKWDSAAGGTDACRLDLVMEGCGSPILIDSQRQGHLLRKEEEGQGDIRWCRNNHPGVWESELTRDIDQGCQESHLRLMVTNLVRPVSRAVFSIQMLRCRGGAGRGFTLPET